MSNAAPSPTPVPESDAIVASSSWVKPLRAEIGRVLVGQEGLVDRLLVALLTNGHVLLEGVPGLAKTLAVRTLSSSLHAKFQRIQFTPDLLPADVIGTMVYHPRDGTFSPRLGPIFANLVLADEINRAPAKVQSALLEAMQERSVTVGQETFTLPKPFFVLATQNPIEQEGTYPLPEAQKDRFLFLIKVDYPTREDEREIIARTTGTISDDIEPVLTAEDLQAAQALARKVPVADHVVNFVLDLVRSTRPTEPDASDYVKEMLSWGAGPRASQQIVLASKVRALLKGRTHVTIEDVEALAAPALRHRLVPTFHAEAEGITVDMIIAELVARTKGAAVASHV
ncbi:MAG: MoxR family ATPase [Verrucomicrobiales bacterium]|nr:MoxR family ATPase [Verrucomicrobiales bacterium]